MRAIHFVGAIDIEASGPSYTVPRLCESLIAAGVDTRLAVLDWVPGRESPAYVKRFPLGFGPKRLGCSPALYRWLEQQGSEILHNHGLWLIANLYLGRLRAQRHPVRLIASPRGTLSEWALNHHRWRKRVMWLLGQKETLARADAFHATAESEYEDIRRLGFRQPVAIIPNGIDVPPLEPKSIDGRRRLLYLGRIHKKKGVDVLLHAWRAVQDRFPSWELVIVGPDDGGYLEPLQRLAADLGVARVNFLGPVYGAEKLALYRSAHLYVLPTHSENFAMTVAEALAAGTPAIVTRGAPWAELEQHGAGWWIEIGVDPLVACLEEALSASPQTLVQMGANGRAWMAAECAWEAIGPRMLALYRWLTTGGERPAWVRTD